MKKTAIALVSIIAGLLIIASLLAFILGIIYTASYSPAWLGLLVIPVPALIAAKLLFKAADGMNGHTD